jgi:RNA polymerase-binding transcription factor DksA
MSEIDTNKFKNLLLAEKEKLENELSSIGRRNPENPDDWEALPTDAQTDSADLNDFADNIEDFETNTAILKQLETQLVDVTDALEKIENGNYGICEKSGKQIELDRLEANPAARTCKEHMND